MVRNIVLLGGNSHPELVDNVAHILGVEPCDRILGRFSGGESRCEIKDSVRGKDVYIIQSSSGNVNDNLIDLCIMISACKTGSAKRVTAVVPLFPYSRQPDWPYNKAGAPLSGSVDMSSSSSNGGSRKDYTFESVPATPRPGGPRTNGITNGVAGLADKLSSTALSNTAIDENSSKTTTKNTTTPPNGEYFPSRRSDTVSSVGSNSNGNGTGTGPSFTTHDYENPTSIGSFQAKPGYKQWIAQAGTLVADLLTCAGADHIITMDLHDPQYQGFFDIPVDNLYGKALLQNYIQQNIPDFRDAVVVSPDAGGAKRATAIADALQMDFALIHKERRPIKFAEQRNASMMLVGDVANRTCILVDDLADTANTITRAAKLLKRERATRVIALLTHGVFSGDSLSRVNASGIDRIIVTNSVPQGEHCRKCPKLEVLDISPVFAEAIRRVHHGESISVLFQYS